MKKYIFTVLSAVVLALGFTSCIDEEGPGTPSLKKMHLEKTEFTYDLRTEKIPVLDENGKPLKDDKNKPVYETIPYEQKFAEFQPGSLMLRWIDVTNATYALSFSNNLNTDVKETLSNTQVPGDLSTLSTEIKHQQVLDYIEKAEIWQDQFETQKDENNKDISIWFQVATVNLNVTGTPIDKTNTALDPEGSTATAVITIYRDQVK